MAPGPTALARLISLLTMSSASSQLMRTNPDLPRLWMLRLPSGSKSTRFIGYSRRFFEYSIDFWHMPCAPSVVRRGGVNVLPRAVTDQDGASSASKSIGVVRSTLPSFT